jgi:cell pole-organizing protein PopZ
MAEVGAEKSRDEILAKVQQEFAEEARQSREVPADMPRSAEVLSLNLVGDVHQRRQSVDENTATTSDQKGVTAALAQLAAMHAQRRRSSEFSMGGTARTLEDVVREMLQPMLQGWLEEKLPGIIERLAQTELSRVIGEADLT